MPACALCHRCPMDVIRLGKYLTRLRPHKRLNMGPATLPRPTMGAQVHTTAANRLMAQPRSEQFSTPCCPFQLSFHVRILALCERSDCEYGWGQKIALHLQNAYSGQQAAAYGYSAGGQSSVGSGAVAQAAQGLAPEQQAKLSQIVAQVMASPPLSLSSTVTVPLRCCQVDLPGKQAALHRAAILQTVSPGHRCKVGVQLHRPMRPTSSRHRQHNQRPRTSMDRL